jgi:hypothetical protein
MRINSPGITSSQFINTRTTLPSAQGGVITSDDNYFYHTFTSNGTLTVSTSENTNYLMVAGGGSGGTGTFAGGGGAGGLILGSVFLEVGTYTITIGAGGPSGSNGTSTELYLPVYSDTIVAQGGGRGGNSYAWNSSDAGQNGGSGGGGPSVYGSYGTTAPGSSPTLAFGYYVQGNSGGYGMSFSSGAYSAGGGGGWSTPGLGATRAAAGRGGAGIELTDWGLATNTGEYSESYYDYTGGGGLIQDGVPRYYYGGGGGGGLLLESGSAISRGASGLGGGGLGRYQANSGIGNAEPENGIANTGGGGGGGSSGSNGVGGSGIFIVRYAKKQRQ